MKKLLTLVWLSVPVFAAQWKCKSSDKLTVCSIPAVDDPAVMLIFSGSGPNGRAVEIAPLREHIVIENEKGSTSFVWMTLDDAKPVRVLILVSGSNAMIFDHVASQLITQLKTAKALGVGFHTKEGGFRAVRFDVTETEMPELK